MTAVPSPCVRREIEAHFAGRATPRGAEAMRVHLPACASCRAYFERHLLVASLDPGAMPARERIAVGLGLRPRRGSKPRAALVLASALAFVCVPFLARRGGEFVARGGAAAESPTVHVYRVDAEGSHELSEPGTPHLRPDDALAFAYSNPRGYRHLLAYGVDEHGHVYWYYPAWLDAKDDPHAAPAMAGPELHELPEKVRQPLDGRTLTIDVFLLDEEPSVRTVEARVATGDALAAFPGAYHRRLVLSVEP